jgi:hypothetical protein
MEKTDVDEALVYHAYSKEYSPIVGNQKLLEETGEYNNLHPCWTLLPHHTGEMLAPEEFVEKMIENGVCAVRVFPKTQNWTLSEWCAGHLLKTLEVKKIPLFVDFEETDWNQIYSLCIGHTDLPVVLTGAPFRFSRKIYALFSETSNLYIDTSLFQLHCGIEEVCTKFGADRLLFGTAAPHFDHGPSVMAVRYARISEEEKAMIASGNLCNLLGIEKDLIEDNKRRKDL